VLECGDARTILRRSLVQSMHVKNLGMRCTQRSMEYLKENEMSGIPDIKDTSAASPYSQVHISGDGWEFNGPAFLAWRIKYYASMVADAANTQGTAMKNAVHMHALGKEGERVAAQIMDDEWHCGNEPHRWPVPHPHWTDQLIELALYADSLPQTSTLRSSALHLAQGMLSRAREKM